jgi:hypothetical protein
LENKSSIEMRVNKKDEDSYTCILCYSEPFWLFSPVFLSVLMTFHYSDSPAPVSSLLTLTVTPGRQAGHSLSCLRHYNLLSTGRTPRGPLLYITGDCRVKTIS